MTPQQFRQWLTANCMTIDDAASLFNVDRATCYRWTVNPLSRLANNYLTVTITALELAGVDPMGDVGVPATDHLKHALQQRKRRRINRQNETQVDNTPV